MREQYFRRLTCSHKHVSENFDNESRHKKQGLAIGKLTRPFNYHLILM